MKHPMNGVCCRSRGYVERITLENVQMNLRTQVVTQTDVKYSLFLYHYWANTSKFLKVTATYKTI